MALSLLALFCVGYQLKYTYLGAARPTDSGLKSIYQQVDNKLAENTRLRADVDQRHQQMLAYGLKLAIAASPPADARQLKEQATQLLQQISRIFADTLMTTAPR